jgi:O-antigen ligase
MPVVGGRSLSVLTQSGLAAALPILAALVFSAGAVFNGFDNAFGPSIACLLTCLLLSAMLLHSPPRLALWRRLLPVVLLWAAAVGWAVLPLFVTSLPRPLAPDMMGSEVLELIADLVALICGVLVARQRETSTRAVHWLVVCGAIILVLGLALRQAGTEASLDFWQPNPDGRFGGTLGNANVEACYAAVICILAIGQAMDCRRTRRRTTKPDALQMRFALYCLTALLAAGACVLTASRTTTVLMLLGALVLGARYFRRRRQSLKRMLPFALGATVIILLILSQYAGMLMERFGTLSGGRGTRIEMWRQYGALAERSPWFGYGLGSFPSLNTANLGDPLTAQHLWAVNSAHNIFLQLMLQAGLPYMLLIVAAALWVAYGATMALRHGDGSSEAPSLMVAVLVVVGCAMDDIALDMPAIVMLTLFLAGLAWGHARLRDRMRASRRSTAARERQRVPA